jgi:hypothetical protein
LISGVKEPPQRRIQTIKARLLTRRVDLFDISFACFCDWHDVIFFILDAKQFYSCMLDEPFRSSLFLSHALLLVQYERATVDGLIDWVLLIFPAIKKENPITKNKNKQREYQNQYNKQIIVKGKQSKRKKQSEKVELHYIRVLI